MSSLKSSSLTTNFDQVSFLLFRKRLLFAFILGMAIASIYRFTYSTANNLDLLPGLSLTDCVFLLSLGHMLSFGVGAIVVTLSKGSLQKLRVLDFVIFELNLLLGLTTSALLAKGNDNLFSIALILFLHAALVPCRLRTQIGLALTAVFFFPASQILASIYLPDYWTNWMMQRPDDTFEFAIFLGTVELLIAGVASTLVTSTLYRLRKSLKKAERVGNYIIEEQIGEGGMGRVYRARHGLIQRPTAIKIIQSKELENQVSLQRFEREVRLTSTLTHPNTIVIYDFGLTEDHAFYYAMEYLEGIDLEKLVERYGPLSLERAAYILDQICGSLAEAHKKNIVHRDIKPSNFMLTERGGLFDFVKVLDFGLAKEIQPRGDGNLTQGGEIFGTPRYISPEGVHGRTSLDGRSDIYTLGLVAFWLVTGEFLFESKLNVEILVDHVKTLPRKRISTLSHPVAMEFENIVLKCLEKEPSHRFQTMTDLRKKLRELPFLDPWTCEKAQKWWEENRIQNPIQKPTSIIANAPNILPVQRLSQTPQL